MIVVLDTDIVRLVAPVFNAGALQCVASWRDIGVTAYTPGRTVVAAPADATTTIVPSPVSRTRVVDQIQVYNPTLRFANAVIELNDGSISRTLWRGRIAPLGRLHYTHDSGFSLFAPSGVLEQQATHDVAQDQWSVIALQEEKTYVIGALGTAGTSYVGVEELQFVAPRGRPCLYEFVANMESSATTVGAVAGVVAGLPGIAFNDGVLAVLYGGSRRAPASGSAGNVNYGVSPSVAAAAPTDTAVGADRVGGNLIHGAGVVLSLYEDARVAFGFGGENVSGTVKLKPGTMVAYAFGPEISP